MRRGTRCGTLLDTTLLTTALLATTLLATTLSGCSAPQAIDAVDLRVNERQRDAMERLRSPDEAAAAHLDLAWLCLLHGVDCASLSRHAEAALHGTETMALAQLTRALARQQLADVQLRAAAWLDLLLWCATSAGASQPKVVTLAYGALARLAEIDLVGVRGALDGHVLSAQMLDGLARGAVTDGMAVTGSPATMQATPPSSRTVLLRLRALATWSPKAVKRVTGSATLTAVVMAKRPIGRRLYADFEHLTAAQLQSHIQAWTSEPKQPSRQKQPTSTAISLRPQRHGAMDRVHLPLPGKAGVYATRLLWPRLTPGSRWTLALRASRPFRVWLASGAAGALTGLGRGTAERLFLQPVVVGADGVLRGVVALPIAAEGERLAALLLPGTGDPNRENSAKTPVSRGNSAEARSARLLAMVVESTAAVSNRSGRTRSQARHAQARHTQARRTQAQHDWHGPLMALLALERGASKAGLRRALDRTLDHLPHHVDARIRRAELARDESQIGLARRLLEPLARRSKRQPSLARRSDLQLAVAQLRQLDGLGDLAVAAAERAVAQQPGDCRTYWRAMEVAADALARDAVRRILANKAAVSCRAAAPLRHATALATVGRNADAMALLRRSSLQPQWRRRARRQARALAYSAGTSRGSPGANASGAWASGAWASWAWAGVNPATRAARAAAMALVQGRDVMARAAWTRILLGPGSTTTQRRGAWLLGGRPPWRGLTIDGAAWVKAHPPSKASPANKGDNASGGHNGAVTWLLDHEIVVPLPGGGALRRVHQIVRVHTTRAAESVGELTVPGNAELVLARTHTADGRVVSPADTPDKETLSLREVTPGAVVEYVQVQFVDADDAVSGATRLPVFLLQSRDGPVVESRYVVLDRPPQNPQKPQTPQTPQPTATGQHASQHTSRATGRTTSSSSVTVRVDVSATAPTMTERRHGPWRVRQWRAVNASRFHLEPRANRAAWQLAAVRASISATFASIAGPWADTLAAHGARHDLQLAPWLRKARQAGHSRAKWQRLISEITAKVGQKRVGAAPGSPGAAIRDGQGDRASLLRFLAHKVGVRVCLMRIRPWSKQPSYGAPDPADYSLSALTMWLQDAQGLRQMWLDPGVNGALFNYLRPGLRQRPALRIGCAPTLPTQLVTPNLGRAADRRDVVIDVYWRADGQVQARVQDTLRGALAAAVRQAMHSGGKAARAAILRQLSSATFPAMKATWRDMKIHKNGVLVLRYDVHADAAFHRQNRLILGLVPYRLGRRYAKLDRRQMVLRFGHQLNVMVTLRVRSEAGALLLPQPIKLHHTKASLRQTMKLQAGALLITHHLRAEMGLVKPGAYPDFARTLRGVDRAEMLILRRNSQIRAARQ